MFDVTTAVIADLAPTGVLRAAINYGNPILAKRNPDTLEPNGVSVDLAKRLAQVLNVEIQFVCYDAAGKVVAGLEGNEWDVAFVARDPIRGKGIEQTFPYVIIEGAYAARKDSPIVENNEVDQPGITVVVGKGSAYDLFLTRNLVNATILRSDTSQAVVQMMVTDGYDVAAGVRQQLKTDLKNYPNLRMLNGKFMTIEQAMGTPKGRVAGANFLAQFLRRMIEDGIIKESLNVHKIQGATVAPSLKNK